MEHYETTTTGSSFEISDPKPIFQFVPVTHHVILHHYNDIHTYTTYLIFIHRSRILRCERWLWKCSRKSAVTVTVVLKQQRSVTTTQQNTKRASNIGKPWQQTGCNAWTTTFPMLQQRKYSENNNLYLINQHDSRNYAHIWSEIDQKLLKIPVIFFNKMDFSKIVFTHPPSLFGFGSETFSTRTLWLQQ